MGSVKVESPEIIGKPRSPVRWRAVVAGSERARCRGRLTQAVKSALVVRAERNAAPCGASHAVLQDILHLADL